MEYTVREWQKAYKKGAFKSPDRDTQVEAGWYDWFCDDSKLVAKTKRLAGVISRIKEGGKLDIDATTLYLVNCMPIDDAPTYDAVRFCVDGDVVLEIDLDNKVVGKKWCAYDPAHSISDAPVFTCETVTQLAKWLNGPYPEPDYDVFRVAASATADEIRAEAKERTGQEFPVLMRVYQRDDASALKWLEKSLSAPKPGCLYVACLGKQSIIGYPTK